MEIRAHGCQGGGESPTILLRVAAEGHNGTIILYTISILEQVFSKQVAHVTALLAYADGARFDL